MFGLVRISARLDVLSTGNSNEAGAVTVALAQHEQACGFGSSIGMLRSYSDSPLLC